MNNDKTPVILAVDDQPNNLDVLSDLLGEKKYEVLFALDGENALERCRVASPDLVLLDVMMPGIDGFETCKRLKADGKTREIPVIFMTALSDTASKVTGFASGGVDYITKPFEAEEVLARVNTHLKIQRLQTELKHKNAMLAEQNELLADRARHLASLVEEKTEKIENVTLALVNALEDANYYNDSDTGDHIRRISKCAAFIAEKYGCDHDFVKRIRLYSSLHDVGKVGLSDALLKKPGRYTKEEFAEMNQHVVIGARMLDRKDIDPMAGEIALYHHEKWDGSGYVSGLSGEHIPLAARIVALVDVYDALLSKRVYKDAFPVEEANRIMRESAGSHFEPKLVEILFENRDELLRIRNPQ